MKTDSTIRFESYVFDPVKRSLCCAGKPVPIKSKTFDLLACLIARAGDVVTKDELMESIWPDSIVEESNLTQHIFLLRRALAEHDQSENLVITIPGRGYKFTASVEAIDRTPTTELLAPSTSPDSLHSQAPRDSASLRSAVPPGGMILHTVHSTATVIVEEDAEHDEGWRVRLLSGLSVRGKRRLWIAAAAVMAAAAALGAYVWINRPRPVLRKVVLAQFQNLTGEAIFDNSLQSGLRIDLEQSPAVELISRDQVNEALQTMLRQADTPLTPEVAREVCEREDYQVVLTGTISRVGSQYLVTLEAASCATGNTVAAEKEIFSGQNDSLAALDSLTRRIRRELGETRRQIADYQVPLKLATTPSLDALRAYSMGIESIDVGDEKTGQMLLEQAVQLDPNFVSAWEGLGRAKYNSYNFSQAATYYKKAFELRARTTTRERLIVESNYYEKVLDNSTEAIQSYRLYLDLYPRSPRAWIGLGNLYTQLGQYPEAIEAASHAVELQPHLGAARIVLARALKRANRLEEAKQTARAALEDASDSQGLHSILFQIAWAQHDAEAIKTEGQWGLTHQHAGMALYDLGEAAFSAGKVREAVDDMTRSRSEALRTTDSEFADDVQSDTIGLLVAVGEIEQAKALYRQAENNHADPAGMAIATAEMGNLKPAEEFVSTVQPGEEENTRHNFVDLPTVRAELALKMHKPEEAIRALEPARRYQMRDFDVPTMCAQAEFEAGQLDAAAQDYRLILTNQGVDPIAPEYSLAHLGLARVLAKQKRTQQARTEYKAFLDLWKDADPGLHTLVDAKRELSSLP